MLYSLLWLQFQIHDNLMSTSVCNESEGNVADWSKALVLGTSHFDGVGVESHRCHGSWFFPLGQ